MIVKDESPLDIDDNKLLRSRLNEQSDLIMILKESADREMQRCRDYEFKLSLEQDKYFDVTQELEEAKHRLIQCQHQNAHLLKLVADMEKSKKVEKQSSGTQCFLCRKPETIDQGSNTASNHKETLEKLNRLRQERDNLDMENNFFPEKVLVRPQVKLRLSSRLTQNRTSEGLTMDPQKKPTYNAPSLQDENWKNSSINAARKTPETIAFDSTLAQDWHHYPRLGVNDKVSAPVDN
ncbi:unnamed protein product [Calicophoron daubneyi]|uniref:Uncharacterized protein n=1 Tax=Calicophoron daubneyi TaxID=300641 RepID=A0AAV2T5K7_CALDB